MVGQVPATTARKLGPFSIGRKLGSGGMASVFAARQEGAHLKRLVALKVLAAHISQDDPEQRRFVREAQLATRLEHPNIVRTYDVGEIDGKMYLAMELIHGASLLEWSKKATGPAPIAVAVKIVHDVARALHMAHELSDPERGHLGLVHQDVSPANILVGYDGIVKLLDFGVARLSSLEGSHTKTIAGKPAYLSPEQVNGKDIERRSDIFALGIVFWELLTGQRLFKRDTEAGTYLAVINDPIPDVTTLNPNVHRAIAGVIAKALDRDKSNRFATAEELRKALIASRMGAGIPDLNDEDVAKFIRDHVPPTFTPADLEREIVTLANRPLGLSDPPSSDGSGSGSGSGSGPGSAPESREMVREHTKELYEKTEVRPPDVPDLEVPLPSSSSRMPAARPAASAPAPAPTPALPVPDFDLPPPRGSQPSVPSVSGIKQGPSVSGRPSAHSAPAHGIALDPEDDDDFDMHIERNVASTSLEMAQSSRSMPAARMSHPRIATSGLEVSHVRPDSRSHAAHDDEEPPTIAARLVGFAVSGVVLGVVAAALIRFARPQGGIVLTKVLPHAFDGSSAPESGVVALTSLVLAIALGFAGVKSTPRAWSWVGAGAAMLLLSIAMVTVTLASTGETFEPPDGVLLVPWLAPPALLLLGLGVGGRAAALFARRSIARKAGAIPVAAIAGVICFVAYASSKLVN